MWERRGLPGAPRASSRTRSGAIPSGLSLKELGLWDCPLWWGLQIIFFSQHPYSEVASLNVSLMFLEVYKPIWTTPQETHEGCHPHLESSRCKMQNLLESKLPGSLGTAFQGKLGLKALLFNQKGFQGLCAPESRKICINKNGEDAKPCFLYQWGCRTLKSIY